MERVIYRLTNERETGKTIGLSPAAWFGILDLAEVYGWRPMGTVHPQWWLGRNGQQECCGSYTGPEARLVMWEDALNLAEALEQAFLEYEPRPNGHSPRGMTAAPVALELPSIGAILGVADLCRQGDFCIEQV
jgi:hypothetical protein